MIKFLSGEDFRLLAAGSFKDFFMSEYIEHDQTGASVGVVEKKSFTFAHSPDGMLLESGAVLSPVTIAYETCGNLNSLKNNAVLVCHALSGDSHVAGYYSEDDPKPGWWDFMVGPGKGIDTDKYFVICANILGSCYGSTGPCALNPETKRPYGLDFPFVTISDMVSAQKALIDHLGIEKALLPDARFGEGVVDEVFQVAPEPFRDGDAEALLATCQDIARQLVSHRPFQDVFGL